MQGEVYDTRDGGSGEDDFGYIITSEILTDCKENKKSKILAFAHNAKTANLKCGDEVTFKLIEIEININGEKKTLSLAEILTNDDI
ncbi:hypothetical protein [Chondrinema litorale]|uniref:hypothetical protein n=1 Tax=Chondrinema litorale TaxID=2994555 RepID=UPI0025435BD7|nr:hypothetical protein [Chondrinema litorale]UZS00209.1 hypothetical protein OQ292_40525 [Chondrinema litorale]